MAAFMYSSQFIGQNMSVLPTGFMIRPIMKLIRHLTGEETDLFLSEGLHKTCLCTARLSQISNSSYNANHIGVIVKGNVYCIVPTIRQNGHIILAGTDAGLALSCYSIYSVVSYAMFDKLVISNISCLFGKILHNKCKLF